MRLREIILGPKASECEGKVEEALGARKKEVRITRTRLSWSKYLVYDDEL